MNQKSQQKKMSDLSRRIRNSIGMKKAIASVKRFTQVIENMNVNINVNFKKGRKMGVLHQYREDVVGSDGIVGLERVSAALAACEDTGDVRLVQQDIAQKLKIGRAIDRILVDTSEDVPAEPVDTAESEENAEIADDENADPVAV